MPLPRLAKVLTSVLNLSSPPVALAFVAGAPDHVRAWSRPVPSACALWRHAEQEVFYASAEQHYRCPIGAMTMGFDLPGEVQGQLRTFVQLMMEKEYLGKEETPHIPTVPGVKSGIVYGPLDRFPMTPDLALVWCTPAQAMILEEAVGDVHWKPDAGLGIFGRPACAALPVALRSARSTLSLGCTGMRTFTGIEESRLLVALPRAVLDDRLGEAIERIAASNESMKGLYQEHKRQIEKESS